MVEFIEYQRFSSLEEVRAFVDLLNDNGIPFEIDDSTNRFDLSAITSVSPMESGISIKIRVADKEKVDKLNQQIKQPVACEHYMYSLSDEDIIDAVVNPEEWTNEESILANEIMKQRNIKPTAEIIKSSRFEKIETKKNEKPTQKKTVSGGASWFLWIGILSMINLIFLITQQNVQFLVGLGLNYVILGISDGIRISMEIDLMPLAYVLTFIVSGLYLLIWHKSKNENKTAYLIGLIIYGLDTVVFVFSKDWFCLGFHIFAIIMLSTGYNALIVKKKETETANQNKLHSVYRKK